MTGGARRGDLDGLRAIAVLGVVVFHLDPAWLPGGFIGVDIFFVLSGYLITGTLVARETFDAWRFYRRRFWRLIPAVAATCLWTVVAGWFLFLPADYAALVQSAWAALFGVSNIWFAATLNYFDGAALLHPLLHTWSLGVEEQFYLVWPWALLAIMALRRSLAVMVALTVAATVLALVWQSADAQWAYYMMPARAFQFLAGAALFIALQGRPQPAGFAAKTAAAALLIAICTMMVLLDETSAWPGPAAIALTVAVLPLLAVSAGPAARLLSLAPLRWVGLASYSIYLVHWPLIVFARTALVVPPTPLQLVGLGIGCIALGATLYLVVERPFQDGGRALFGRLGNMWMRLRGPITGASFAALLLGGIGIIATDGVPSRFDNTRVQRGSGAQSTFSYGGDRCSTKANRCIFGDRAGSRTVYLIGDSHALNLVEGLHHLFADEAIRGIAIYAHGCAFLPGHSTVLRGAITKRCETARPDAFATLARNEDPLIVVGAWYHYTDSLAPAGTTEAVTRSTAEMAGYVRDELGSALRALPPRRVVIMGPIPKISFDPRACLRAPQNGLRACGTEPAESESIRHDAYYDALARIPGTTLLSQRDAFCKDGACFIDNAGEIWFRDNTHLTNAGSRHLIGTLAEELMAALFPAGDG